MQGVSADDLRVEPVSPPAKPAQLLYVTFANGKTQQVVQVVTPLGANYSPRAGSTPEIEQANAYRALLQVHQLHMSVTARVALLLQNAGATTAEDVTIEITVPDSLELAFAEREPPPKSVRKSPVVLVEPSPRAWRSDGPTRAQCRVGRVPSSVGLPQLFLTLRNPKAFGVFALDLKLTSVTPPASAESQLLLEFLAPEPSAS